MKVLVTGGAGYIGSYAVKALLRQNHEVVVLDNLSTGSEEALVKDIPFYKGDIRDSNVLDEIFINEKIDLVMHFAAKLIAPESIQYSLEYYDNNVNGVNSLLTSMKKHNVTKIVFSSTAAVYGLLDKELINENDITNCINPYGETKLASEKMIQWSHKSYGLEYIIFRYFNVAGGKKTGYSPLNQTVLIPRILNVAKGLVDKVTIFGNDYNTIDGTCIRDFIHVEDLVNAHILAAEGLFNGTTEVGIYNLGNGKGFSVLETYETAKKVTGINIPFEFSERRIGDPVKSVASSEKAQKNLGWKPKYDKLEEIILDAWENY
ncbi:UDP-glucose 4-epimerase GalE [Gottfriedia luciferensis]|uniref:UDP-glucose 4-epimerase n=1 Tax=Gottfriedia luciferensis TaxID=178774 RepID=A0ABX2ZL81_9BACI|nr:UDP-glucose 4-epimerase GalE [Gottfriedia luciferensis]ODG90094.1 UDP-glucose 4-epimerase GalE [Gottfriedia luciferensis]